MECTARLPGAPYIIGETGESELRRCPKPATRVLRFLATFYRMYAYCDSHADLVLGAFDAFEEEDSVTLKSFYIRHGKAA